MLVARDYAQSDRLELAIPRFGEFASRLADGDVVHIGNYNLLIHVPAQDGPLTVEVMREGTEDGTESTAPVSYLARYRLAESFFTKKRLTWWGLGFIVGGGIILLLLGQIPLGTKVWHASTILSPGNVTPAHNFIGHKCEQCHADAFRVPS